MIFNFSSILQKKVLPKTEVFLDGFLVTSHHILHLERLKINLESQFQKTPYPSQNYVMHPSIEHAVPLSPSPSLRSIHEFLYFNVGI